MDAVSRTDLGCTACALRSFCPDAVANRRRLKARQALFRKGDRLGALYAVRAGFLKTNAVSPRGERRILGYHIAGDVLGLDAIAAGTHPTEAVALDGCEVCEIPMQRAEAMMAARPASASELRSLLSERIASAGVHAMALGGGSARQRVAGFLLDLGTRWALRGRSATEFDLCLTRKEIGSYLGLTFETVSRTLSHFHSKGWIGVAGREIRILERAALQDQCDGVEAAPG